MIVLTKQERKVFLSVCAVVFLANAYQVLLKNHPQIKSSFTIIDGEKSYFHINPNTASQQELERIPYIGAYTAQQIIQYRQTHGVFTSIEQLKEVKGIRAKNFMKFKPYLAL